MVENNNRPPEPGEFHGRHPCIPAAGCEVGCVHLQSVDGILFCIHRAVLMSASLYFRSTLARPINGNDVHSITGREEPNHSLPVNESSDVVELLLGIISGQGFDIVLSPTADISDSLQAARKYEMNGVLSAIRLAITSDRSPFKELPLQLAQACHQCGWLEEYHLALERSLSLDISDPWVYGELCLLDGTVVANIHRLRSLRINRFKTQLYAQTDHVGTRECSTSHLGSECICKRSNAFLQWKLQAFEEFTRYPSGHTLLKEAFNSSGAVSALFSPHSCFTDWQDQTEDLAFAKSHWRAVLGNVVDDVIAAWPLDLDACLETAPGPDARSLPDHEQQDAPISTPKPEEDEQPLGDFHRQFSCQCSNATGYIHLQSGEGTLFCIHPAIMTSASGFFRSTLSLPQCEGDVDVDQKCAIQLSEPTDVVIILLNIICGWSFYQPMIPDVKVALDVLSAAEKYEMAGVVLIIRYSSLSSRSSFKDHPLQLALACHRSGWSHEYRIALERTLSVVIPAPTVFTQLCALDRPIFSHIHKLRSIRVNSLKARLFALTDDPHSGYNDDPFEALVDSDASYRRPHFFLRWKRAVISEFEVFPSGDTLFRTEVPILPPGVLPTRHLKVIDNWKNLPWVGMLRGILDEIASELALDLDLCLQVERSIDLDKSPETTIPDGWSSGTCIAGDDGPIDEHLGFSGSFPCISEIECTHLRSNEGVLYCLHAAVLRGASDYFRVTLPVGSREGSTSNEDRQPVPIQFSETSEVMDFLLGIVSGRGFDAVSLPTVEDTVDILRAAEKYELKGVTAVVQCSVLSNLSPFKDQPLQMASVCHRYGWSYEYTNALVRTLSLDTSAPDHYPSLCALEGIAFSNIYKLRYIRNQHFRKMLLDEPDDLRYVGDTDFVRDKYSKCTSRREDVFLQWKWLVIDELGTLPIHHKDGFLARISSSPKVSALLQSFICHHPNGKYRHDLEPANTFWMSRLGIILDRISSALGNDLAACCKVETLTEENLPLPSAPRPKKKKKKK